MSKFYFLFFILFSISTAQSQNNNTWFLDYEWLSFSNDSQVMVVKNKLVGLTDTKGNFIIPIKYKKISVLGSNRFLLTDAKDKCGIVDAKMNIIIPFEYDNLGWGKSKSHIWACKDNKCGYINDKNETEIPFVYMNIGSELQEVQQFINDYAVVYKDGLAGVIDRTGKMIIPFIYKSIIKDYFYGNKNHFIARLNDEQQTILNAQNEFVIPPIVGEIKFYENGLFLVSKDKKYGIVNSKGEWKQKIEFDAHSSFEKRLQLMKKGKWAVIDADGNFMMDFKYSRISCSENGLMCVSEDDQNFYFISSKGEKAFDRVFNNYDSFVNGIALMKENDFYGAINEKGKTVIPFKYKKIKRKDDNIFAQSDNKLAIYDILGKLIKEVQLAKYSNFDDDFYFVKFEKNGKFGLIDFNGNIVVEAKYDDIEKFEDRLITKVRLNDKYGVIDRKGNVLLPVKYENFPIHIYKKTFIHEENEQFGLLRYDGKISIPLQYENLEWFKFQEYLVATKDDKEGLIDINNKQILPFEFDDIKKIKIYHDELVPINDYFECTKNNTKGILDVNGKIIVPFGNYEEIAFFSENKIFGALKYEQNAFFELDGTKIIDNVINRWFDNKGGINEIKVKGGSRLLFPDHTLSDLDACFVGNMEKEITLIKKDGSINIYNQKNGNIISGTLNELKFKSKPSMPIKCQDILGVYKQNVIVSKNKKDRYICDLNGNALIDDTFDYINIRCKENGNNCNDLIYSCYKNEKINYYDKNFQPIIAFNTQSNSFHHDKIIESIKEVNNIYNLKGKLVATIEGYIDEYKEYFFIVKKKNNKFEIYNYEGNLIVPIELDKVEGKNSDYVLYKGTKKGLLNDDGKVIIPCIYDELKDLTYSNSQEGIVYGKNNLTQTIYYYDREGHLIYTEKK